MGFQTPLCLRNGTDCWTTWIFLAQPFLPTGWVPLSQPCNAGGCNRGGTLRPVISLANSEDETHMSDLRTVGRDCPCSARGRWLPGQPPLPCLPVDTLIQAALVGNCSTPVPGLELGLQSERLSPTTPLSSQPDGRTQETPHLPLLGFILAPERQAVLGIAGIEKSS